MWVDQKDLKLYITGADMPRIHAAARLVGDLISKAPVNVNSAGVEDEVGCMMYVSCLPLLYSHFRKRRVHKYVFLFAMLASQHGTT